VVALFMIAHPCGRPFYGHPALWSPFFYYTLTPILTAKNCPFCMNIQLSFSLTADEYVNLMRYIVNWRRYAWLMGFALLFVGVQVFLNGLQALLYLLVIVVFAIFMYFSTQRSIRKVFEMSPHLNLPLRYHITEDEFQVITDEVQNSYTWDAFWKAREVPEWFLLHQNERVYNYVPKRAFNSPAEVEEFRKFLVMKGLL